MIDREGERKWSFRSKGDFDVNSFARKHFEGGGHRNAAGGSSDSWRLLYTTFKEVIKEYKINYNKMMRTTTTLLLAIYCLQAVTNTRKHLPAFLIRSPKETVKKKLNR